MKRKLSQLTLLLFLTLFTTQIQAQVVINEVLADGTVELKNLGAANVDVENYWLCERPTYNRIGTLSIPSGEDFLMEPNEILVLSGFNALDQNGDEVALYTSSGFGNVNNIIDFVQWGEENGSSRASLAVQAGLWPSANQFAEVIGNGESLQYFGNGTTLTQPSEFVSQTPNIGDENVLCTVSAGDIVISEIGISNTTSVSEDGMTAVICVDGLGDPINVDFVNPGSSQGTNSGWVITDATSGEILALPMAPPFDLDGADIGICQIWYLRYEDGLVGKVNGGNIDNLEGCFDLSNPLTVIREAADAGSIGY